MRAFITVYNRGNIGNKAILFGSRHNLMLCNYGNSSTIDFEKVEFDEWYKEEIGLDDEKFSNTEWRGMHSFLMDLVHYDFRVISLDGKPLKYKVKGSNPIEYKPLTSDDNYLDPYLYEYEHELRHSAMNTIVVELIKV